MKRFTSTVSQKSAKGKVGHAVGKATEALQCRKAEQQIGRAGNGDRRPERNPARGIKERASKRHDSGADSGGKTGPNKGGWPFRGKGGGMRRSRRGKGAKTWGG